MSRIVNGVVVPDDPNETADKANRVAAGTPDARLVPPVITNDQVRQAMLGTSAATLDAFEAYVAGASRAIRIYWQYNPYIRRNHPNVEAARVALGRTQAQIDSFFRNAKLLT